MNQPILQNQKQIIQQQPIQPIVNPSIIPNQVIQQQRLINQPMIPNQNNIITQQQKIISQSMVPNQNNVITEQKKIISQSMVPNQISQSMIPTQNNVNIVTQQQKIISQSMAPNQNQIITQKKEIITQSQALPINQQENKPQQENNQEILGGLNIDEIFNKHSSQVNNQLNEIMNQYKTPQDIENVVNNQVKTKKEENVPSDLNGINIDELLKQQQQNGQHENYQSQSQTNGLNIEELLKNASSQNQTQGNNNFNLDDLFKGGNTQIDDKMFDKLFASQPVVSQTNNNINYSQQIQSEKGK